MVNRGFFQGRLRHSCYFSFSALVMRVYVLQKNKVTNCGKFWQKWYGILWVKQLNFLSNFFAFLNLHFTFTFTCFKDISHNPFTYRERSCVFVFQMEYWQRAETVFDLSLCESKLSILTSPKLGKFKFLNLLNLFKSSKSFNCVIFTTFTYLFS